MSFPSHLHRAPIFEVGRIYTERLNFLMKSSGILASCLNKQQIFDHLACAIVPYLADWCSIVVLDGKDNTLSRLGIAHVDPIVNERLRKIKDRQIPKYDSKIGIPMAIRTGKSELIKQIEPLEYVSELYPGVVDPEYVEAILHLGAASMITVPMEAHGQILGAISIFAGLERQPYESSDLALTEELSRRASLTLSLLNQLEHAQHDQEILEIVLHLYQNFISSRVVDTKTRLTTARLNMGLLSRGLRQGDKNLDLIKKVEKDFDSAIESISSLSNEAVGEKLLKDAKKLSTRKN